MDNIFDLNCKCTFLPYSITKKHLYLECNTFHVIPDMLALIPYDPSHFAALNYRLNDEQAQFTMSIEACIHQRKDLEDAGKSIIVVMLGETPIGFFILDQGTDKLQLTANGNAVLIRSYSIHPGYQGRGYGKKVMELLTGYVQEQYPGVNELVLSVNLDNEHARRVYLKAGFSDTGRQITGIRGPQYVLSKQI